MVGGSLVKFVIFDLDMYCYLSAPYGLKIEPPQEIFDIDDDGPETVAFVMEETEMFLELLAKAKIKMTNLMQLTMEKCWGTHMLAAVDGKFNYRADIFPGYKGERTKQPVQYAIVKELRHWLVSEDIAIYADGKEADDFLRIWSEECKSLDIPFTVSSYDKDLFCIEGEHYDVRKDKKRIIGKEEALKNYYVQLIMGDSVDKIPGVAGMGPKKAEELISYCDNEEDMKSIIKIVYQDVYGDDWKNQLLANGKLIHIQRHWNDWFTLEDWDA